MDGMVSAARLGDIEVRSRLKVSLTSSNATFLAILSSDILLLTEVFLMPFSIALANFLYLHYPHQHHQPLHKKWSFPLRICSINVTKPTGSFCAVNTKHCRSFSSKLITKCDERLFTRSVLQELSNQDHSSIYESLMMSPFSTDSTVISLLLDWMVYRLNHLLIQVELRRKLHSSCP